MSRKPQHSLTELLREAIAASDLPLKVLERETGVQRGSIRRFLEGETSLRLDLADKLAEYFGVTMQSPHAPCKPKQAKQANRVMRLRRVSRIAQRALEQLSEGNLGIARRELERIVRVANRDER